MGRCPDLACGPRNCPGVGFAVYLYFVQIRDRRADQASRVNVLSGSTYRYSRSEGFGGTVKFRVSNTSDAPAYDIEIQLLPWEWRRDATVHLAHLMMETLPPQGTSSEQEMDSTGLGPPPGASYKRAPLALTFTDAHGRRWRRWPDGSLKQVKERPNDHG